jgi:hypothetical protein
MDLEKKLSKLSVNDSMSVPQTNVGNGERSQISQALVEPTIEAAMLRPLAIHQCIPNSERVHRVRPRICRFQVTNEENPKCAYCLQNLTRGKKYYCFKQCYHIMHARCAMNNLINNGIDPKSCTMFCPICHPRSVSDRYHY